MAKCKSCDAPIVFLRTGKGYTTPVDDMPGLDPDEIFNAKLHRSHFATCPDAEQHRRSRAPAPAATLPLAAGPAAVVRTPRQTATYVEEIASPGTWGDRVARVQDQDGAVALLMDLAKWAPPAGTAEPIKELLADRLAWLVGSVMDVDELENYARLARGVRPHHGRLEQALVERARVLGLHVRTATVSGATTMSDDYDWTNQ